jgi:hypothetical protein
LISGSRTNVLPEVFARDNERVARFEREVCLCELPTARLVNLVRDRTWDQLIMSRNEGRTESTSEDLSDTKDEESDKS